MTRATHTPGLFVWREIVTPDVAQSKKFYGALFGWTFEEVPMPDGPYTMIKHGDAPIGGVFPIEKMGHAGAPPHWMSYVSVPNVDEAAAAAKSGGGTLGVEPCDIPNVGRFAVIGDPQHAYTTAFRSSQSDPEPYADQPPPGAFCWDQLNTPDVEAAKAFYSKVYGWSVGDWNGFTTFNVNDRGVASVMQAPEGVPAHWLTYVVVADLAKARNVAAERGGRVLLEAMTVPEVGTIAVIQDDVGATIGLMGR